MRMLKGVRYTAVVLIAVVLALVGRFALLQPETSPPSPGGPFTLVDGQGKAVTDQDFRGRWMLVYFGYTYCPDVCPTGLQTISQALRLLPSAKAEKVQPLFISVDPQRDTPEAVGAYVQAFDPSMIGLTGTEEQVAAAAKAYRVYYRKAPESGRAADDYLVDHSAMTWLMGPDGRYVTWFAHGLSAEEMAAGLARLL
ncbi:MULTISPECIES: SCO family protein [unclassified Haematospirillum]|uniref:SCO family protein n=1 Tax=unclassified Haematospirillum TaxID=2622088 RepID=UPI001FD816F6|nr:MULTISPECIES: SCO family protein [unclassified Haematospirillum]